MTPAKHDENQNQADAAFSSRTARRTIVLGISGGIAAYKTCELASYLTQNGFKVLAVLTEAAQRFVTPLTFQALTGQPVYTSLWPNDSATEAGSSAAMAHIHLADVADAVFIAPASADLIARLAQGRADDLLSTLALATTAPLLLAPAMNPKMWAHPATQRNLQTLRAWNYHIIEPEGGRMACEHVGVGRLPDLQVLATRLRAVLENKHDLQGLTVLITAGPTREMLDPVRFISNRSSGRMGYALAQNAAQRGAHVILVSGPTNLPTPHGVTRHDVIATREMLAVTQKYAAESDIIIAAAAPADFAPQEIAAQKIKKSPDANHLQLDLAPTPDILATLSRARKARQTVIGFAAETENLIAHAQDKLARKNLDAIVANDVTQPDAGFDVATNRVTWISTQGAQQWPLLDKSEVAARILDEILALRAAKS